MWDIGTVLSAVTIIVSIFGYVGVGIAFVVKTRSVADSLKESVNSSVGQLKENWTREMDILRRDVGHHLDLIRTEISELSKKSDAHAALQARIQVLEDRLSRGGSFRSE